MTIHFIGKNRLRIFRQLQANRAVEVSRSLGVRLRGNRAIISPWKAYKTDSVHGPVTKDYLIDVFVIITNSSRPWLVAEDYRLDTAGNFSVLHTFD